MIYIRLIGSAMFGSTFNLVTLIGTIRFPKLRFYRKSPNFTQRSVSQENGLKQAKKKKRKKKRK